jgi:hypothetical protein
MVGEGKLGFNLSGNYYQNKIDGAVNNPSVTA